MEISISIIWVVFSSSLAFGDDIGSLWVIQQHFHIWRCRSRNRSFASNNNTIGSFCFVSDEVYHHNSFFDNGLFAGTWRVLRLSHSWCFSVFFVCAGGSLTLASGRPSSDGVHWLCWWYWFIDIPRCGSACRCLYIYRTKNRTKFNTCTCNIPFVILGAAMLWLGWFWL